MTPTSTTAAFPFPSVGPRRHDPAAVAAVAQALAPLQPDGLRLVVNPEERRRLSRDAYDYSPVLTARLAAAEAELVVCPVTVEQVKAVAAACARHQVPITMRGAGTGNYGQAVPLLGGVLLTMTGLQAVRSATADRFTAEAGCRLVAIDETLAPHGAEQRLLPSTYRTATIGGFVAGGSGGIGSVAWGFLRDPGNVLGMEIITVESQPRRHQLMADAAAPLNHAYGTNGIIVALTLPTAPLRLWQELLVAVPGLEQGLALADQLRTAALPIKELSLYDQRIAAMVRPLQGGAAGVVGCRLVAVVAVEAMETVKETLAHHSGQLLVRRPQTVAGSLRELTWNHTTLHARAADPAWTYLQLLLPPEPAAALHALGRQQGDGLAWHLEAVQSQGEARWAALPLLRWQGAAALAAVMETAQALGCTLFNPHVITVEDGGLGVVDGDQVQAKQAYDPAGLLNPGKLRGWLERGAPA
ncbi:MAG: FAD-binding oxidoreductase [Synechococcus sp. SB0666_bin_14]|nr:FAD-binding oxidoreductase [Synechococcus sp. SB0666_bin_14]MYA90490.1 FAD-binding oxidoreductase [Synechococcus sp. SB0663_bin_10]MYG47354.1 FAD-binding oxidoreductase [Synechococcus sp. SB0675_bin_6]MYK90852.1 FAD-binding oxidoreductase [Synechococcus sp. SB0669_bin_8]